MQPETSRNSRDALEPMWETHREFLRRLLIGMTRDIDLADDLLQESYLKARSGIGGYQGGDSRAWLSAIAKSSFYSHLRHRYVRCEIPLDDDCQVSGTSVDHLDLIEVRRAVSELPDAQRRALVMKHYGGYNYEDIAAHMECPIGTAKSRVSLALRRLREALAVQREEIAVVKCADLAERTLMDYIYGRMPDSERKRVEEHLAGCSSCRERAAEVSFVLRALDAVEVEVKGTGIIELHEDGAVTCFLFVTYPNTGEARETLNVGGDFETINFVMVNGEEAIIEPVPGRESQEAKLHLARPIAAGERAELLMVGRNILEQTEEEKTSDVRKMGPGSMIFDVETLFVMAVRLPPNARLLKPTPEPQQIRSNGATTVIWRKVHGPNEKFEFAVEYRL